MAMVMALALVDKANKKPTSGEQVGSNGNYNVLITTGRLKHGDDYSQFIFLNKAHSGYIPA